MERLPEAMIDESRYRTEVLLLDDDETEHDAERKLLDEALELGLKLPEIDIATSLATSMSSGAIELLSPLSVARPSLEQGSSDNITSRKASIDPLDTSLSETTPSSPNVHDGSLPSVASLSTCPTSQCSSNGRSLHGNDGIPIRSERRQSTPNAFLSGKRRSFIHAIGKLPLWKRRASLTTPLPPSVHITVNGEDGPLDRVFIGAEQEDNDSARSKEGVILKLEVPILDEEALQRSLGNPELREMRESHRAEITRHIVLQTDTLQWLRIHHRTAVANRRWSNELEEKEKRERNIANAARLEERHIAAEVDQRKEFEREKRNSQTRIKYMERYCGTPSPTPPPAEIAASDSTQPARKITHRQKQQLAQEYLDQESMDQLHEAKIKVLRDRQERQLQEAISRMEKELEQLSDQNAASITDLERKNQQEEQSVLGAFDMKRARLTHRWTLEEAIIRKKLQLRDGLPYGPLPPLPLGDLEINKPVLRDPWITLSNRS